MFLPDMLLTHPFPPNCPWSPTLVARCPYIRTVGRHTVQMAPISRGPIKTAEEKESLTESLRTCPLFGALTSAEIAMLVDAMKPEDAPDGSEIITQGEEGDRFYVLESGQCNIFQAKERGVDKVLVIKSGGYFGELAVMYNTPRAATVTAVGDCKLWWLDRVTVKTAIVKHTIRNRERFDGFLSSVPILSTLTETERLTVADALRVEEFEDGDVIIRQNDPGNTFYIVNDGSVVCTQQASPVSPPVELCKLGAGQYFGEIALLTDRPRQATVTASGSTVCLSLDRRTFRRVMGPLQDVLKRNISTYNTFMAQKI